MVPTTTWTHALFSSGGQTQGLALRLAEESLESELFMVWLREMVGGTYKPDWATLKLNDGRKASAIILDLILNALSTKTMTALRPLPH